MSLNLITWLFSFSLIVQGDKVQELVYNQSTPNVGYLDKAFNNLMLIDQYQKENAQQFERLLECNNKMALLENELNLNSNLSFLLSNNFGLDILNNYFMSNQNSNNFTFSQAIINVKNKLIEYFK